MSARALVRRRCRARVGTFASALAASGLAALLCACTRTSPNPEHIVPGGDAKAGAETIAAFGCGSCHVVPGVTGARGKTGPPLTHFAERSFIAGAVPNNRDNLLRWIRDPQSIQPGTAMPTLGVSESDARNMAAYLYTLK
jgi:cytochrome c1